MSARWRDGNHVELLENGEAFYPRLYAAIDAARREVLLETFILRDDKVGQALQKTLIAAAQRGVRVEVTVDAWGSMGLTPEFIQDLTTAGVGFRLFGTTQPRWLLRLAWFRRLHRKIVVVDGEVAFVGGINFCADHLADFGPEAKQDYAAEVTGPVVADIHGFVLDAIGSTHRKRWWRRAAGRASEPEPLPSTGAMTVMFVTRDNRRHRTAIERHYRAAIATSKQRLVIANAYFFPGYRLLRDIRNAARRGVDVRLLMQGEPDMLVARLGARMLYDYLLRAGVRIYEYCERPFHGKVALTDDTWATVGSSNLDPLSLSFNLEANVAVRSTQLNVEVYRRLERLMNDHCTEIDPASASRRVFWRPIASFFVFHFLRRFPRWVTHLPAQQTQLTSVPPPRRNGRESP